MLTQWGLRIPLERLRGADALELLESRGVPDARIAPLDQELRPLARADRRVCWRSPIPAIGPVLGLTIAAEIGDVGRFPSPRKPSGCSRTLRFAAVEAAQGAWRESNPWHRLYSDVKTRTGKANPAKSAVARKVLIACWHVLSRGEPFKPSRPRGTDLAPASSSCFLAA